jgi:hypothetical protein
MARLYVILFTEGIIRENPHSKENVQWTLKVYFLWV